MNIDDEYAKKCHDTLARDGDDTMTRSARIKIRAGTNGSTRRNKIMDRRTVDVYVEI